MKDTLSCSQGHLYDKAWADCPYCEESEERNPEALATLIIRGGLQMGEEFPVLVGTTLIGKGADCDIVLEDDYVSSHHAQIETVRTKRGFRAILTDLGSTNGTFINNSESDPDADEAIDQTEIRCGDTFSLGTTELQFFSSEVISVKSKSQSRHVIPSI